MQRLIDWWTSNPKWWKGFYLGFGVGVVVLLVLGNGFPFAMMMAFIWGSMIAFALWSSEKLKERMGLSSARPREDESEREWRRRR